MKVLYDYEAIAPGELTVEVDELLLVFETDQDWLLVQSKHQEGKAGYVPGNYVEPASELEPKAVSRIVVPDSVSSSTMLSIFVC